MRENVLRVVAHDLRNPFSTINLATSRLAQSAPRLPADLHEVPEVIKPYVRRGNRMIGDLLDTAQIAAGKLKVRAAPSAPARTISAVVATHRPLIDEHELTLEVAVMEGLPVLGNLLGNAIKFTPAGG